MRLLLIRPGAIGDFILSLPALEAECAGATYIEVWTSEVNRSLARFAHGTRSLASTGLDWLELPEVDPPEPLLHALRSFDRIVSWYGANRPEFRDAAARHGIAVELRSFRPAEVTARPALPTPPIPRTFAVVHPFASSPAKRWPLPRFEAVTALLREHLPVHWCAGPNEPLDAAVRIPNLYDLACWLAGARVYIGNDSGISHLAAAVGTPVVALFGPTNPAVWSPRGERVIVLPGMENVTPEQVVQAALQVL